MSEPMRLSIVIPAFNEERRLPATLERLSELEGDLVGIQIDEVLVVDDGSTDRTAQSAESLGPSLPGLRVLSSSDNRGKGHAVREGLKAAVGDWVLIADADMSTPWEELLHLTEQVRSRDAQMAIASRDMPGSDVAIRQSFLREHLGKCFNVLIRTLTGLPFRDTQCGFKLVHRTAVLPFLDRLRVDRFAWDVEFLVLARDCGLKIVEVPVRWEHRERSRVHPIFDGCNMAWTVLCLQCRRWLGRV